MSHSKENTHRAVVAYTADRWEHVCPVVRITGPAQQAGLHVVQGCEWQAEQVQFFPERVLEADIIVIQRDFPCYANVYQQVIANAHSQGKAVVYELDDLLMELPAWHPDVPRYREARVAILQAVMEADAVTCSSHALRDWLKAFNPNVWTLPNYVNDHLWADALSRQCVVESQKQRPVVVGYLGGHSHLYDLEMIKPVLLQLLRRYGDQIVLRFWGGAPPPELLEWKNVEWLTPGLVDYAEFARYFAGQECDVFIAPLSDNLFNRCKSFIKYLEYSALGVPGVYSRVTPYEEVVTHSQDGFLASTPEEWAAYLADLIDAPSLRYQIGQAARRTVCDKWLLSQHAQEWARVYDQILDSPGQLPKSSAAIRASQRFQIWHREMEEHIKSLEKRSEELNRFLSEDNELIEALSAQSAKKEWEIQALEAKWTAVATSPGWKLVQTLTPIREWLVPRKSWREQTLASAVRLVRTWRQVGLRGLTHQASLVERQEQRSSVVDDTVGQESSIEAGQLCPLSAISVVVIQDTAIPSLDEQSVVGWASGQTCRAFVNVVLWDKNAGMAWIVGQPEKGWRAVDTCSFCEGVPGRYICVASYDLLQQNETYLESNLIALETESLAFTVNVRGNPHRTMLRLMLDRLPDSSQFPLFRQVVRKDCLGSDLALDLGRWGEEHQGNAVGKLIVHETKHSDSQHTMPFQSELMGFGFQVSRGYIWIKPKGKPADAQVSKRVIHPVDTVLTCIPEPLDRPTVIVMMPFLAVGGAERVALDMMRNLQNDIRFVVVTWDASDPVLGTTADAFRQVTPYVFTAPDYLHTSLNLSFVKHLVERFKPCTVYIANGSDGIYNALGQIKQCYPTLRVVNQVYDHRVGWINRYDADLVACVEAHIGVNSKICQAYISRGARPDQVHLIEHGVDIGEFDPARYTSEQRRSIRKNLRLPQDNKLVTFIARIHPQKRPMDFVELARHFADDPSVTFLMVGNGPLTGTVDSEIARAGIKNLIRRPFYSPSRDIFAISDVVVLPSEYEGMPVVILEAQAMGKPVVVTDVGNTRDILDITKGGVVVSRVGDIAAFQRGVQSMLIAPPEPRQIRQAIANYLSLEKIAAKYRRALLGEQDA